ncbi:metabotropic glutamate receptor 2-like [Amphiura filiformis]|uniref:metabotropic glutamate receptor 2-like n=1 Tax=Amphiura filiformis TaxID=82378 RepID=UPI003B20C0E6
MFVGIFLAYFTALLFGVYPSRGVCVMRGLGQPIATSLIYVPLAVKTFRLFRIFKASVKSAKRPKFIRPKSQVILALSITTIPVLWTIIWLFVAPPTVIHDMPYENEPHLQVGCSRNPAASIGIHAWNLVVILVCSILAFLTRQLPENFNETKFITFCAFCSFLVFLAFSTTNITVTELYYKAGYTSLALIVNATMILFCLFFVKLYAIYFVKLEAWNVRKHSGEYQSQSQETPEKDNLKGPSAEVTMENVHNGGDNADKGHVADDNNGNTRDLN